MLIPDLKASAMTILLALLFVHPSGATLFAGVAPLLKKRGAVVESLMGGSLEGLPEI
jgi:hypothetical protein